jgi:hypothetical protein
MREYEEKLKLATRLAGQGKVSRRDFVQLALAAGITAASANAMFVTAVRADPKKGGHAERCRTASPRSMRRAMSRPTSRNPGNRPKAPRNGHSSFAKA